MRVTQIRTPHVSPHRGQVFVTSKSALSISPGVLDTLPKMELPKPIQLGMDKNCARVCPLLLEGRQDLVLSRPCARGPHQGPELPWGVCGRAP